MRLICPWCGERDAGEFTYRGDASVKRPPISSSSIEEHQHYVFDRHNPAGPHQEIWHHTGGCRGHVIVKRDTVSHELIECVAVGPWASKLSEAAKA